MKLLYHHLLLLPLLLILRHGSSNITSCSQTPYPEVCFHFLSQNAHELSNSDDSTQFTRFHDSAIQATVNQAMVAHAYLISAMDLISFEDDDNAKSAWIDCLELYEDAIDDLTRSIIAASADDFSDRLTRLSASIANQQTCRNGFVDFGYSSHLHYFPNQILRNFSELVSNSLAITKAAAAAAETSSINGGQRRLLLDSYPVWLSNEDRELLKEIGGLEPRKADIVVAQDGTGDYRTISEAVAAAAKVRKGGDDRFVIYVKRGVYKENVVVKKKMKNIMIIGDGIDSTIVTGRKNVQDGSTTFQSATFAVSGDGFVARDMSFENTAGPEKHQAVALRSSADHSVFFRCSFKGYQDTLYAHSKRQFYRECHVYGTVDFIFGDATAVFQSCNIYLRKPMNNQRNTVTAQARSDPNENTGFVIHNSIFAAAPDLRPVATSFRSYLGRPWKAYSRTVIMKSYLDGLIDAEGWLPWEGNFGLNTLYYGEFMNSGSGAATRGRVKWGGYHVMTSGVDAGKFTVGNFLGGESWIPATGVPYAVGL